MKNETHTLKIYAKSGRRDCLSLLSFMKLYADCFGCNLFTGHSLKFSRSNDLLLNKKSADMVFDKVGITTEILHSYC